MFYLVGTISAIWTFVFYTTLYVLFLYSSSTASFVVSRYFLVYHFHSFVDFWTVFGFSYLLSSCFTSEATTTEGIRIGVRRPVRVTTWMQTAVHALLPAGATSFWKLIWITLPLWGLVLPFSPNLVCCPSPGLQAEPDGPFDLALLAVTDCDSKAFWFLSSSTRLPEISKEAPL